MSDQPNTNTRGALLRDRNFAWFIGGAILSMLGDQFTLIALPWLVLKMTGDTLVLGIVLALVGAPRAVFILIGGAAVDRYSPKRVLMLTKYVNTALLGALGLLVLSGSLSLWMVYALALAIGLATAFSIPSAVSMLPHIVAQQHLQTANSMQLGVRQFTMFAGPLAAGFMIAFFGDGRAGIKSSATGLGIAFMLDALSFALSAWTLSRVAVASAKAAAAPAGKQAHVLAEVAAGLRHCWNDVCLRVYFLYFLAVMLLVAGPIQVAIPVLAVQLENSAAAFGILVAAHPAGALAGMIVSGAKPGWRAGSLGATILLIDLMVGALSIPMGQIAAVWQGVLLMLAIGLLSGFMQVRVFTWMQQRVPRAMLGRAMSIFMFIFVGIAPLSAAATGWLMRSVTTAQIFAGSGALLIGIALIALLMTPMREISDARASS